MCAAELYYFQHWRPSDVAGMTLKAFYRHHTTFAKIHKAQMARS